MLKTCVVCKKEFTTTGKMVKSCSAKCSKVIQKETMGHAPNYKHGFTKKDCVERLHNVWRGIIKRCLCKTGSNWKNYGGRGISICNAWLDYVTFREWALENGYREDLQIDRIDNNGNYEPSNCRWTTRSQQCRNRRTSKLFELNGEVKTTAEWAEIYGIKYATARARLLKGTLGKYDKC